MAIACDISRNCTTPNVGMISHSLNLGIQGANHPRITNPSNVLAISQKSWSPINTINTHQSTRTLHNIYIEKTCHSKKVSHATRPSCFTMRCGYTTLNNMQQRREEDSDKSRSLVIAKCEMEPKGQDPTSAHDEQQHDMCGEKKHTKKDHLGGYENQNKSCNKRRNAHLDPKPGSEWHDVFHGELREWKGTRSPVHDEDYEEDPCNEYTNQHNGCEDDTHTCSSLNASYKGHNTSLFPTTSYGPNFYAPIGTIVLHYHFDNPSQS